MFNLNNNNMVEKKEEWYRHVKYNLVYRYITKKIKLNIFLASENNSNILAPILGQYGIKPLDFVVKLKESFMLLVGENKFESSEIEFLLKSLVFSFILFVGKNNIYNIVLKKFSFSFLYNVFLQRKRKVYFNVLFLYKLSLVYLNKFKVLFFLLKRLLKIIANKNSFLKD